MAVDGPATGLEPGISWTGGQIEKQADGSLRIPLTQVDADGVARPAHVVLGPDRAAVFHAQIDRLLTEGWAMTEQARLSRQQGEIFPVGGF